LSTNACRRQPAKTPKTATKLKVNPPKAPTTNEKKSKDSAKASKPRAERKKSKAAVSDEDADEEAKEPEKELDPAEAKAKKEKEGLYLACCSRKSTHSIQSSFYGTNFRKGSCPAIKLPKKAKWLPCPISSQNSKITVILKSASSVPPRSTRF
jgi:hypothetical protein